MVYLQEVIMVVVMYRRAKCIPQDPQNEDQPPLQSSTHFTEALCQQHWSCLAWIRAIFLVQLVLVVLNHVDEECDGFLLSDGDGPEVPSQSIG